jgi:membrane associated rhomboid family serine protease
MFIPFINFRAWDTVLGLGCFEILGLLRGWMSLDHAAHLGGLIIGYIWAKTYIGDVVKKRKEALRRWYGNYGGK